MPLAPQTVDVPLQVVDQISPTTSGPIGKIHRLVDAQVTKYQGATGAPPTAVRAEKRDAFATLSDVVRQSSSAAVITSAPLDHQTLLTEFAGRRVLVSRDQTHVYSEQDACWLKHDYQLPTFGLSQEFVHTSNSLATTPDCATAQDRMIYTWFTTAAHDAGGGTPSELAGVYMRVVDEDGVELRGPTRLSGTDTRIKVVSDGTRFWVFSEKGDGTGNFTINLVDVNGVILATTTFAVTYTAGDYWDIGLASYGVVHAQGAGGGVSLSKFSWNGTVISRTTAVDATMIGKHKLGFLTNGSGDAFAYLATIEHVGVNNNTIQAYRIPTALASNHTYTVAVESDEPCEVTGYVLSGSDIVVAWGRLDNAGSPNYLKDLIAANVVPFGGGFTRTQTVLSMNLASRAFKLGESYYAVGYYPSNLATVALSNQLPNQPTFFLVPLPNTVTTQRTAGRWDYAAAYCDWQASASASNFHLASVAQPSAGPRVALSYRAESFTSQTVKQSGDLTFRGQTLLTTVGIKATTFGAPGEAFSIANELLIPGPVASSWSGGEFSEQNVNLGFEAPVVSVVATGGSPPALTPGTYQWVVVGEWTDENGNRVRSAPSQPTIHTVAAGFYASVQGFMLHATNKKDLLISIYRTDMVDDGGGGFVPTTTHYKVTFDAPVGSNAPLYNDDQVSTWTYADSQVGITANEILYTDKGQLPNYPAPAFSRGCVWRNRAWVLGYDGAVWFSAEPTPGDGVWFHPAFRVVLPSTETPTGIAALDDYLLVFTERSVWYVPPATLPDSSGANGSIPTPVRLPFQAGGIGPAVTMREGVAYASSAGGVWFITRALENRWLSESMVDVFDNPVTALVVDGRQRICAVTGTNFAVFDSIARAWCQWTLPGDVFVLGVASGVLMFGDDNLVWSEARGTYCDKRVAAGVTTLFPYNWNVDLNFMHFAGIRNYKSCWKVQGAGDVYNALTVRASASYDDDETIVETRDFVRTVAAPLVFEWLLKKTLCSSVKLNVTMLAQGSSLSDRGAALEVLSFEIGLQAGLNRVAIARRT